MAGVVVAVVFVVVVVFKLGFTVTKPFKTSNDPLKNSNPKTTTKASNLPNPPKAQTPQKLETTKTGR